MSKINYPVILVSKLSDHEPIVEGQFCTFNLMCQGAPTAQGCNNAFNLVETQPEYHNRLRELAGVIKTLYGQGVRVFTFQEFPKEGVDVAVFETELRALVPELGNLVSQPTLRTRSSTAIVADQSLGYLKDMTSSFELNGRGIAVSSPDGVNIASLHGDFTNPTETVVAINKLRAEGFTVGTDSNCSAADMGNITYLPSDAFHTLEKAKMFASYDTLSVSKLQQDLVTSIIIQNANHQHRGAKIADRKPIPSPVNESDGKAINPKTGEPNVKIYQFSNTKEVADFAEAICHSLRIVDKQGGALTPIKTDVTGLTIAFPYERLKDVEALIRARATPQGSPSRPKARHIVGTAEKGGCGPCVIS